VVVSRHLQSRDVPKATVQRLPLYLRCLEDLGTGNTRISSDQLAEMANVTSAKVRKDLSFLGSYGVRGVGYEVEHLRFQIEGALGLSRDWAVVIVGVGNLGRALANYGGFPNRGFKVVGLFDDDSAKVGKKVAGTEILPMRRLNGVVKSTKADIGVITTPTAAAQDVADRLANAGIKSILNFAPQVLKVQEGVELRRVDLSTELQVLSFYLHRAGH